MSLCSILKRIHPHLKQQCSSHGKPPEVHCDTCDKLICHLCIIKQHRNHECDAITDAFPRHQQQIVDGLQQVEEKLTAILKRIHPHLKQQCSSHGKPPEVHCDTCDKLICHLCIIKQHRNHECDAITDAFPRHQQQIVDGLQQVEEKLTAIITAVQAIDVSIPT